MIELQKLLEMVIEKKASDLHITTGAPPTFRIDGKIASFDPTFLTAPDTKRLCYSVLTDAQSHNFEEENELDAGEMESNFFEGGEIRLSEIACEQIFLEVPYQPLCVEDCKGLCPRCGRDLNLSSCDCDKEEWKTEFSILRKMKLDLS